MRLTLPLLLAVLAVLGLALSGCATKRWLRIESDPPGALVYVNGERQAETTPMRVPFVYYGDFEVRLEKGGYESLSTLVEIESEIDGYPVVDLPFELAVRERRFVRRFTLKPLAASPTRADARAALERARAARSQSERAPADGPAR